MFDVLIYVGAFCLILGVVYPICAIIVYPFYRMLGGKKSFFDYMRSL